MEFFIDTPNLFYYHIFSYIYELFTVYNNKNSQEIKNRDFSEIFPIHSNFDWGGHRRRNHLGLRVNRS